MSPEIKKKTRLITESTETLRQSRLPPEYKKRDETDAVRAGCVSAKMLLRYITSSAEEKTSRGATASVPSPGEISTCAFRTVMLRLMGLTGHRRQRRRLKGALTSESHMCRQRTRTSFLSCSDASTLPVTKISDISPNPRHHRE